MTLKDDEFPSSPSCTAEDPTILGYITRVNGQGPWVQISIDEYKRIHTRPGYEFQAIVHKTDGYFNGLTASDIPKLPARSSSEGARLNTEQTVSVYKDVYWLPMSSAPVGVKLHVLNLGNVATHAIITEATRKDWKGWQSIPRIPDWMER